MFERFTAAARTAVVEAQERALEFGHPEIGPGHVLLGALADGQGSTREVLVALGLDRSALLEQVRTTLTLDAEALASLGIDLAEVRRQAEATFGPGALDRGRRQRRGLFGRRGGRGGGHLPFTGEAKSALENALRAAVDHHHAHIGTEHLLLGLLATAPGTTMVLLQRAGVAADRRTIETRLLEGLDRAA